MTRLKALDSTLYARQLIFDRELDPVGEELLYRERPAPNRAPSHFDPDRATSRVLVNAFMCDPRPTFSTAQPAFVNFSATTLARELPFPTDRLVVEVLESVKPDPTVRRRLERLKQQGFRIALDDYVRHDAGHPLLDHADIVKLEYPAFKAVDIRPVVARLRERNPTLIVLVEKLETRRDLERARAAGSDLFQGYILHRPELVYAPKAQVTPADLRRLRAAIAAGDHARLAAQLDHHPALACYLGRLVAHHRHAPARRPIDARQIVEIIQPAGLEAMLDIIEAARPRQWLGCAAEAMHIGREALDAQPAASRPEAGALAAP
ncbi:EAL and HDOD domain-containing protein [Salinisphaera sp. LB1]|uniref:EAL and HDOD domain-containing protein n=1 Tax=Salinisphaera sp. LB1 TaxID=2183911 RepID=UPI000D70556B|nr:EAL domain-containing protein [Salinisphaera sp. LB1]AWN16047.1 putative signal transduction protein [Salinisphaera sp. LB1]